MEEKLLEWFLEIMENDGYDLRETKGAMKFAIKILKRTDYSWEKKAIVEDLIGEEVSQDAE